MITVNDVVANTFKKWSFNIETCDILHTPIKRWKEVSVGERELGKNWQRFIRRELFPSKNHNEYQSSTGVNQRLNLSRS